MVEQTKKPALGSERKVDRKALELALEEWGVGFAVPPRPRPRRHQLSAVTIVPGLAPRGRSRGRGRTPGGHRYALRPLTYVGFSVNVGLT